MCINLLVFSHSEHFLTFIWSLRCNLPPRQSRSFMQLSFCDQTRIWSTSGTIYSLTNVPSNLVSLLTISRCPFECKPARKIKQDHLLMETKICFSSIRAMIKLLVLVLAGIGLIFFHSTCYGALLGTFDENSGSNMLMF